MPRIAWVLKIAHLFVPFLEAAGVETADSFQLGISLEFLNTDAALTPASKNLVTSLRASRPFNMICGGGREPLAFGL